MELSFEVLLVCVFAFFIAGFVDAIAGGGGLISLPVLLLTGIPPHYALGTNKLAAMTGTLGALMSFAGQGLINKSVVLWGFGCAFVGSACGSWLALQIDAEVLGKVMVFLLPAGVGVSFFIGRGIKEKDNIITAQAKLYILCIGGFVGLYDGFFGPGAGSFYIIALHTFVSLGLLHASANAKVLNLGSNLGSLVTFASGGVVLWSLGIPCMLGCLLGNLMGVRLAVRLGASVVRAFLYIVLTVLVCTLFYRFFIVT